MFTKSGLKVLFSCILLAMILCTAWASFGQGLQHWGGLTGPDRYWTIATMLDAYCGFLTFYAWVAYKEVRWASRCLWFVAIMLLGNMAMAGYVLLQLRRLRPEQPASAILAARNP
ncbi:MAG: DUF1475 domain-containing protein [Pseudomonadota bacterium]|nr:DUF1475 domain-containing protein [Pseudomonadota bacterium]